MKRTNKSTSSPLRPRFRPTPAQVPGPYFLPDSPLSDHLDLTPAKTEGNPFEISGQVLSTGGKPLAGATVHVWLADPRGVYDNQDSEGNPVALPPEKHRLRGRVVTDENGSYSFRGLRPGNYALSPGGNDYRPGHIHAMVEAEGYRTLVTQLYFPDDRFNDRDLEGDGFFKPELAVQMQPALPDGKTVQRGTFNLVLKWGSSAAPGGYV